MSALENTLRELREPVPFDLTPTTGWVEWGFVTFVACTVIVLALTLGGRLAQSR